MNSIPEEELRQNFKVYKDQDLIHIDFTYDYADTEETNTKMMELVRKDLYNIFDQDKNKLYKVIVEILYFSRGHISSGARKIWIELAKHRQIVKAAVVGKNLYLQVAANFIIGAAGRSSTIHWFSKKQEALEWLGY